VWARDGVAAAGLGLEILMTDPFLDPLRKEPRFQAIERELKFPSRELGDRANLGTLLSSHTLIQWFMALGSASRG
jgi:hypothetical protein